MIKTFSIFLTTVFASGLMFAGSPGQAAAPATQAPPIAPKFVVPNLTSPVMDLANIVDGRTKAALDNAIRDLHDSSGTQITVLTVPTLNGVPIEQASIDIVDQWKLGSKKDAKGVLFLIAYNDHKMRIEVGQGLEGSLPDVIAKRIIEDQVAPYMREGRPSEAITVGVASIAHYTDPEFDFGSKLEVPHRASRQSDDMGDLAVKVKLAFFILFFILFFLRPRRRGIWFYPMGGGGFGGGGWGGGGSFGGGGGWSGGGGGFNGGGASGSW